MPVMVPVSNWERWAPWLFVVALVLLVGTMLGAGIDVLACGHLDARHLRLVRQRNQRNSLRHRDHRPEIANPQH